MSDLSISLQDIFIAKQRIAPHIRKTPLIKANKLSNIANNNIFLKLENLQNTGSFKLRGATNKILSLTKDELSRGVITVSSGNHGRAVAFIAKQIGINATVVISSPVPEYKREAIKSLNAELIVGGKDADAAMIFADELQRERGMTMIHPFDDLHIIAGQGTIGLELLEDLPNIDTVIVPLSGGGLMSGIAYTIKETNPNIEVIGVTMKKGAAMHESLLAGHIVDIVEEPTIADALAGGLNKDNKYTFRMVQEYVDKSILVSEKKIKEAMLYCLYEHHLAIEGGAAVGIAAILSYKVYEPNKNIAIIVSGANVDREILNSLINEPPSN